MKIILTGATGLLGRELTKLADFVVMPREIDIVDGKAVADYLHKEKPDIVLHLAAYTNVAQAEFEKELCYKTNVIGTRNIANHSKYLIYISTEYVFDGNKGNYSENDYPNPVNFYALTKLLGEYEARRAGKSSVLRLLFKPRPYKHEMACWDMWTSGRYLEVMAQEIIKAIELQEHLPRTLHIGFSKISLFELAKQSRPDIKPIFRKNIDTPLPADTSLNVSRWEALKKLL